MNFIRQEMIQKDIVESNIAYFNRKKRKGLLSIVYYVDNGNKCRLSKDGEVILSMMTIGEAVIATAAIANYERR